MIRIPVYDYSQDTVTHEVILPDDELWACGNDFCDRCGDCMACYGDDACYAGSALNDHILALYPWQLEEFMSRHPRAVLETR